MRFAQPEFIYALPVVLLLGLLLSAWGRQRRRAMHEKFVGDTGAAWADAGYSSARRLWDQILLFLLVAALLATLARPMVFQPDERSEQQGAPYLVALDASRSMLAEDVPPSRYSAATNALDHFFGEAKGDRIGFVTFAGIGYLNAPLTFDTVALRTILGYVNPNALVDPGSSLGAAMDRAQRFFESNAIPQRTLIIISDGEELGGNSLVLARRLHQKQNLVIHTIGVGTGTGARIPSSRGDGTARNAAGQELTTRLDETNLRRIANATGGRYYRLGPNGDGLRQLRNDVLRPLAEKAARDDLKNYREIYFVPLALALLLLLVKLILGAERHVRRRPLPGIWSEPSAK